MEGEDRRAAAEVAQLTYAPLLYHAFAIGVCAPEDRKLAG
jgi:hypothetical protein